jgi:hypothetical protein
MTSPIRKAPGESAAAFSARESAYLESLRKRGILGPKDMPKRGDTPPKPKPKPMPPSGGGRGRGGATPPPGMMYGPNDALMPIPKKGGSATGGGRPVMRAKGGMVKGKKK